MQRIQPTELVALANFINEQYNGDIHAMSHYLDKAIYMLGYVPESEIIPRERQDVCFCLHRLKECLIQAHRLHIN